MGPGVKSLRGAARRAGGVVLTLGAVLALVEVPAQLKTLKSWIEDIEGHHIAWTALVFGIAWTVFGNFDALRRILPDPLRGWLSRSDKLGPASFVHFDRPVAQVEPDKGQIAFQFRVFNGNPCNVSIVAEERQLLYGDRQIPVSKVSVEVPPKGIQAARSRHLSVLVNTKSTIAEEIKEDLAAGALKPINLNGLHLIVIDEKGRRERAPLPQAIILRRENQWIAGRQLDTLLTSDKMDEIVEGMILR